MIEVLLDAGIKYDSSVTPTRPLMGKSGKFTKAPVNPYELSHDDFGKAGDSGLWEFPWPIFPYLKLPSGSGVTTRVAGYQYTILSLEHALKTGDTAYYLHPYEIAERPRVDFPTVRSKIFMRNVGDVYFRSLTKILKRYRGRFTHGRELLEAQSV